VNLATITPPRRPPPRVIVHLLRHFDVSVDGAWVEVPRNCQRLIGFLALQHRDVRRAYAGGALWLDLSDSKASACLRSALWRMPAPGGAPLVQATSTLVGLSPHVDVDLDRATSRARELLSLTSPAGLSGDVLETTQLLAEDVLLGWDDEWVTLERERFRQRRLHALDQLGELLLAGRRYAEALEAGLAAVDSEPLRETSHGLVIRIHIAEGNVAEACRQYDRFRRLLADELGARPSDGLRRLVSQVAAVGAVHPR
jgi:DNA-binding SARP family transcriptional activator